MRISARVLPYLKSLCVVSSIILLTGQSFAAIQDWQKSLTLRLNNQSDQEILTSLNDLANTGANWVAITPGWLTDSKTSNNVYPKAGTPSDAKLVYATQQAHNLGLKVML